jgi:RNA polymerase sigma-70 factor (ECF subfamily)
VTGLELSGLIAEREDLVVRDDARCAAALTEARQQAIAGPPELVVSEEQFARCALRCCPDGVALDDPLGALPEDYALVSACAAGDSRAIAAFAQRYFGAIKPALRRMTLSDDLIDELTQVVRHKLFIARDEAEVAPIIDYLGKGDLNHFIRVVATRAALDQLRKKRPVSDSEDALLHEAGSPADTPQMRLLKAKHSADFKQAFEAAMAQLDAQERNILRMSLVAKLSIDEICGFYGIHRATAARRLARARGRLADLTREVLDERLQLGEGEFTSIVQLVHSQLDLSIQRLLGD